MKAVLILAGFLWIQSIYIVSDGPMGDVRQCIARHTRGYGDVPANESHVLEMAVTIYYKALRPDGTDFATGTTRPRKGRWMPRIDGELIMCERGYHVSDALGETLIGGSWPCKLARVEIPEGEWQRQDHKFLVPTYRVVEWLPAWQALGPNGEAVVALIERAKRMTRKEVEALAMAGRAAGEAAWQAAGDAACDAADNAAGAWDAADNAADNAAVAGAGDAARQAAGDAACDAADNAAGAWDAADVVRDAARNAALALVVRDLISPEHFDDLYGHWTLTSKPS